MKKIKQKKTPWYKEIVNFLAQEGKEAIPVITGIFKGDQSTKVSLTIKRTLLRQIEIVRTSAPNTFQINTDVERAALNIGVSLLYEMFVVGGEGSVREVWEEEDKFTQKMQDLDDFIRIMHKMYSCWEKKVFSNDDVDNMRKWVELQDKHLDRMDKLGLRDIAEEKLKQIKAGEKITNLMECKQHGGSRKSASGGLDE